MPSDQDPSISTGTPLPQPPDTGGVAAQPQIDTGQPPAQAVGAPAAPASGDHHFGRLARSLFTGTQTQYRRDDQGNMIEENVPMKPGAMFRHMLAGALLGASAGEGGTFAQGIGRGVSIGAGYTQQLDARRRAEAEQDFKAREEAKRSAREDEETNVKKQQLKIQEREQTVKETLAKQTIAESNQRMAKDEVELFGKDQETHMKDVEFHKPERDLFESLGMAVPDMPEKTAKQYMDLVAQRPEMSVLKWIPSDVWISVDPKTGNRTHETMYKAYRAQGDVPLSDTMREFLKKNGVGATYPGFFEKNSDGSWVRKNVDAGALIQGFDLAKANWKLSSAVAEEELKRDKTKAEIEEGKAKAAFMRAEAGKYAIEIGDKHKVDAAWKEFYKVGGVLSKMAPENQRIMSEQAAAKQKLAEGEAANLAQQAARQATEGDYAGAKATNAQAQKANLAATYFQSMSEAPLRPDTSKLPHPTAGNADAFSQAGQAAYAAYKAVHPKGVPPATIRAAMAEDGWDFSNPPGAVAAPAPGAPAVQTYEKPVSQRGYTIGEGTRTTKPISEVLKGIVKSATLPPGSPEGH